MFAAAAGAEGGVTGILRASGETVEKVLAEGDATPVSGQLSLDVQLSSQVAVNDAGAVAFRATVTESGVTRQAIFVSPRVGAVVKVVAEGNASPLGGAFNSFTPPALNNAGQVTFGATVSDGAAQRQGIFLASAGDTIPVVIDGGPSPVGGVFALAVGAFGSPALNDKGEVAFGAHVVVPGAEGPSLLTPFGVFLHSGGQITKLVADGDATPLGGTYLGYKPFILGNSGNLLFMSSVDANGDGDPDNQGIFATRAPVS